MEEKNELKANFFNYEKTKKRLFKKIEELNTQNQKLLTDYYKGYLLTQVASENRRNMCLTHLILWCKQLQKREKNIDEITVKDYREVIANMLENGYFLKLKNGKGKKREYSTETIYTKQVMLCTFLRYLDSKKYEPILKEKKIKVKIKEISPADLITDNEFKSIIDLAENKYGFQSKVWMSCHRDSGCRIMELATAKINWIKFYFMRNENGRIIEDKKGKPIVEKADINGSEGKTGPFSYRLTWSASLLYKWVNEKHPMKGNTLAPLFLNLKTMKAIKYNAMRMQYKRCAKILGIKKKITTHIIGRHNFGSEVFSKYPLPVANAMGNWSKTSKIGLTRYFHFSNEQAKQKVDEMRGIIPRKETTVAEIKRQTCLNPNCNHQNNDITAKICSECGHPLDYFELIKEGQEKKEEINELKNAMDELKSKLTIIEHFFGTKTEKELKQKLGTILNS